MVNAERLKDLISNSDSYSKEDYYNAFLDVTEQYLNELMNTLAYENKLLETLDEEEAEELMESVAEETAAKFYENADMFDEDKVSRINKLIGFVEEEFGEIGDDGEMDDDDL